jgi:hypothetical protein
MIIGIREIPGGVHSHNLSLQKLQKAKMPAGAAFPNAVQSDSFNGKTLKDYKFLNSQTIIEKTLTFLGRKQSKKGSSKNSTKYVRPEYEYKNFLPDSERPKANIKRDLKDVLMDDPSVHNANKAYLRIKSLSTYLTEKMVGFETPDGDHWFEKALPYIYKGALAKKIPATQYENVAKEFWGLLSKADNYWLSDDFIGYLKSMNQTPAVKATISAIETLRDQDLPVYSKVAFTGYPSKIKYIKELHTCAYSGVPLKWNSKATHSPSAEHILPHSVGGDAVDIDVNFLIASAKANGDRGSLPLLAYLKGWDAQDNYKKRK